MKKILNLTVFCAVLAVLLPACSSDEETAVDVQAIAFTGILNDTLALVKGEEYTLQIITDPPNSPVRFYNASSEAFRVEQNTGKITAIKGGIGTIIAIAANGNSWTKAYCHINVMEYVNKIELDPTQKIQVAASGTVNVKSYFTAQQFTATNKTLNFFSSNPSVAAVEPVTGVVTVVSKGLAEIRALSVDGSNVESEPMFFYAGYTASTFSHGSGATAWVATSSSTYSSSYGPSRTIDNNLTNFLHWAESYAHPHYLQIDFKTALVLNEVHIYRRPSYSDTRDVEIYYIPSTVTTGDGITWTDSRYELYGKITFGDEPASVTNKIFRTIPEEITTRYLMFKLPVGNRGNSQSLSEVIPRYIN